MILTHSYPLQTLTHLLYDLSCFLFERHRQEYLTRLTSIRLQSSIFGDGIQHTDQFPWPWGDASSYRQHCIHHPRQPLTHPAASGHHPIPCDGTMIRIFQPTNNLQDNHGKPRELARMRPILLVAHQVQAFEAPFFHPNHTWASNLWEICSMLWIGEFELDEESGVMLRVIGAICSMRWHVRIAGGVVRGGGGGGGCTLTFHEAGYGTRKKKIINSNVKKGSENADCVRIARVEQ